MGIAGQTQWFAVQTQVGKEDYAFSNLGRQDFEAWCPTILKTVRSGRKVQTKAKPLFPGYIFVQIESGVTRWRSIDSTYGVLRLVKVANRPAPLPAGLVDELRALVDGRGNVAFRDALSPGDQIRIMGGAFDDWIGQVIQLPDRDRVTLLVAMIGRKVTVTVPRGQVVKAA